MRCSPARALAFAKALPIGDTTELLRQRPDARAAERRLAAATARVGVATADLFPRVSLRGFVGFLSGGWGNLFNGDNRAWQVTPSISWAAFDMGSVRYRRALSEALKPTAWRLSTRRPCWAHWKIRKTHCCPMLQQAPAETWLEQSVAARRAAELAEVRYRAGSSDFLTLLDAQRTQLAADDALAQAEAGVNVAAVIKGAAGRLGEQDVAPALAAQP